MSSEGVVSAGAPTSAFALAIVHAAGSLWPAVPNKFLIALPFVVGGVGMYRHCTRTLGLSTAAAVAAGTFYVMNPLVYERLLAGQLFFTCAYGVLPWALPDLYALAEQGDSRSALKTLAWSFCIGLISIHMGGMVLLMMVISILVASSRWRRKGTLIVMTLAGFLALNAYWALPGLLQAGNLRASSGDVAAFAPRPHSWAVLPHLLLLHGFWRKEFPTPLGEAPVTFLTTFLPLVAAAAWGLVARTPLGRARRSTVALTVACIAAICLASGPSVPATAALNRFLHESLPGYSLYREPQKWVAILALGYAVFLALGVDALQRRLAPFPYALDRTILAAPLLPVLATHMMLWGFSGQVTPTTYPSGWHTAASIVAKRGTLLFLPWHEFQPIPFADDRTIDTPAENFFRPPVLTSDADELRRPATTPMRDPRRQYVSELLAERHKLRYFGHLVVPLGVRYVALGKFADWDAYRFLGRQMDLRELLDTEDLRLYENTAWSGSYYGLAHATDGQAGASLLRPPLNQLTADTVLRGSESRSVAHDDPLMPLRVGRFSEAIPRLASPVLGTDRSCSDGWTLDRVPAVCHLGAFAAFSNPGDRSRLVRTDVGPQLLGYAVSASAIIGFIWTFRSLSGSPSRMLSLRENSVAPAEAISRTHDRIAE
ncbi:MAG: hypothetical protein ABR529_07390 [Actinomycetota bacterium]